MKCPKCILSWMTLHPEPRFAILGWRKCSCGYCQKELELVPVKDEADDE